MYSNDESKEDCIEIAKRLLDEIKFSSEELENDLWDEDGYSINTFNGKYLKAEYKNDWKISSWIKRFETVRSKAMKEWESLLPKHPVYSSDSEYCQEGWDLLNSNKYTFSPDERLDSDDEMEERKEQLLTRSKVKVDDGVEAYLLREENKNLEMINGITSGM